jgi:signal transduction histidine kinase
LKLRYDLLLSRVNLLAEGPQARYLEQHGFNPEFIGHIDAIRQMRPWIERVLAAPANDANAYGADVQRIQAILMPFNTLLSGAASIAMMTQWEETGSRLDMYRDAVLTILFLMIGILCCSVFISVKLLMTLKRARENERSRLHAMELEKQLEAERRISELYRNFGAMVSHQFRTPLAIIDASMQRLLRAGHDPAPGEVARRAAKAREATARLTRLIESTLAADRLAGKIDVRLQECDVLDLVGEVIEHQLAVTPRRRIVLQSASAFTGKMWCDPILTEQILFNLISNAVKYSPEGSPVYARVRQDGNWICCAVSDEGRGLEPGDLDRVFEPYFRAAATEDIVGTGIGLYVARQLALIQHGHVEVESAPGRGSVFTMRLRSAAAAGPVGAEVLDAEALKVSA